MLTTDLSPAYRARNIVRASAFAHLSTLDSNDGFPHGSLVMCACTQDCTPLIIISQLARHTKNINKDPRVSLFFDHSSGIRNRLAKPRLTLAGNVKKTDPIVSRRRFSSRHPNIFDLLALDFSIFEVQIEQGHLIGGFGDIHNIKGKDFNLDCRKCNELISNENDIVDHMNEDHSDTIDLYAQSLLEQKNSGWKLTGCDPEGCDLYLDEIILRLSFPKIAKTPNDARKAFIMLTKKAKNKIK